MAKNKKAKGATKQSKKSKDLSEIWRDSPSPKVSENDKVKCSNCMSSATIDLREVHECPKCDSIFCCETCYLGGGENCCTLEKRQGQSEWNEETMYDNLLSVLKAITVLVVVGTVSLKAIHAEEDEVIFEDT